MKLISIIVFLSESIDIYSNRCKKIINDLTTSESSIKKKKLIEHAKNFPCVECRPDLNYTFFDNWRQLCKSCGREYIT